MRRRRTVVAHDDADHILGERVPLADLRVGHACEVIDVVERRDFLDHIHELFEKVVVFELVISAKQFEVIVVCVDQRDDLARRVGIAALADCLESFLALRASS